MHLQFQAGYRTVSGMNPINLPVKTVKLEVVNQKDIDAINDRLALMRRRFKQDILFVGARLAKIRDRLPHGRWGKFVELNFPLSIKTATIWIRAWEGRSSELAILDWDAYMRQLYGNEPKKKQLPLGAKDQDQDEDDKDTQQSGGEGFKPGFESEDQEVFIDKGRPVVYHYKRLITLIEQQFLISPEYSLEDKLEFITDLINWLETQRTNLA